MSKYESLYGYKNASAEERLSALAHEMVHPVSVIHGLAGIIKGKIEVGDIENIDEIGDWIAKILEAANDLTELREILALKHK